MGKSRRGDKEFSKEQKLIHENRQLKREVSRLRKELARIDIAEMDREGLEVADIEEKTEKLSKTQALKQKWLCNSCQEGHLEVILYSRMEKTFYFRKCTKCVHRTGAQEYKPTVEGIFKKSDNSSK